RAVDQVRTGHQRRDRQDARSQSAAEAAGARRRGDRMMRRRTFITFVGGAAAGWPLAARAQQPAVPVIGFLGTGSLESDASRRAAFRTGLNETGYIEGRNVAVEYRGAQYQYERLPELAAEFVRRPAAVMVTTGTPAAVAAKAATSSIPIVF